MIQPEGVRRKAEKLYPAFLCAWLADEEFFPRVIPCDRKLADNLAAAAASVQSLRDGSKETLGFGYSIDWEERNSRRHGRNRFPRRIYFESAGDFLRLIGKQKAFAAFTTAVARIRARRPELERWIRANREAVVDAADAVGGLLEVVDYFCTNPRPNLFVRELPLSVDTKFIERYQGLLRAWLDIVLPSAAIAADEEHFARRFGLKYDEPHFHIRFLDPAIQNEVGVPWVECAVPLHTLAKMELRSGKVLIVENKTNLLTLPALTETIGIWGMGYGAIDLRYLRWLSRHRVWYWGDMDADGFCILSRLRSAFPHVQSLLMDDACLATWADSIGAPGNNSAGDSLPNLTTAEQLAYNRCVSHNLRIEQERFPQSFVVDVVNSVLNGRLVSDVAAT